MTIAVKINACGNASTYGSLLLQVKEHYHFSIHPSSSIEDVPHGKEVMFPKLRVLSSEKGLNMLQLTN